VEKEQADQQQLETFKTLLKVSVLIQSSLTEKKVSRLTKSDHNVPNITLEPRPLFHNLGPGV
jgi:hypothetical protein